MTLLIVLTSATTVNAQVSVEAGSASMVGNGTSPLTVFVTSGYPNQCRGKCDLD